MRKRVPNRVKMAGNVSIQATVERFQDKRFHSPYPASIRAPLTSSAIAPGTHIPRGFQTILVRGPCRMQFAEDAGRECPKIRGHPDRLLRRDVRKRQRRHPDPPPLTQGQENILLTNIDLSENSQLADPRLVPDCRKSATDTLKAPCFPPIHWSLRAITLK